ncbi:MAG: phosphatidylinositol phosphate synthase [Sciscionella sp.]
MLNIFARASVSRVTDPLGAWLVRRGLRPNTMTVLGMVGAAAGAVWFFPRGELLAGAIVMTAFLLFDLLDGAMARSAGQSTPFGAVLDASCDRIVDGLLFGSIAWWCLVVTDHEPSGLAALICLVSAQVISYIKARAEASGLAADGGLVERAERFIIVLVGAGLTGFGVPYAIDVALWLLAALSVFTVAQRFSAVRRSAEKAEKAGENVKGEQGQ